MDNIGNGLPDRRIGRIQLETDGAQPQWIGADVDWPLAAGDTFCVAFETLSGALIGFPYSSLANGLSNDAGSILPDPWTHDGYSSYSIGCYAVTTTTGSTEEKRTARRSKVIHGDIK